MIRAHTRSGTCEAGAAGETSDDAIPHWKGSLFVFDRRNTVRFGAAAVPGAAAAEPIGTCQHCNVASESFINCCNVDCNRLHLVCPACLASRRGFCKSECEGAPRRRPLDLLASTEDGELDFEATIAATQGPRPGAPDMNRLVHFKPPNVPRKEYDADKHGSSAGAHSMMMDAVLRRDDEDNA